MIRKKSGSPAISRLPAQEVEDLVTARLQALLGSPQRLLDLLGIASPTETERIVKASERWSKEAPAAVRAIVPSILKRVTVKEKMIALALDSRTLSEMIFEEQNNGLADPVQHVDEELVIEEQR